MDAGEHDNLGIGAHRLARQRQAVADDVGNGVVDVRRLIVMRQDDRVFLALELQDRSDVVRQDAPLEGWHMALDAAVELGQRQRRDGGVRRRAGGRGVQHWDNS